MAVIKKPQSAYFQFSASKRKQITEENPGIRIGDVQKLITAQWKELSDEEKQHFIDLAAKDKERYERERLENPVDEAAAQAEKKADAEGSSVLYPLGRVKRIIQSDPDVNKVSREALIAISKASELFAQFLATKSYEQTLYNNKRQIKPSDVTRAMQVSSVLDWLREDFPDVKQAAATATSRSAEAAQASENGSGNAKAKPSAAAFFGQRTTEKSHGGNGDEEEKSDEADRETGEEDAQDHTDSTAETALEEADDVTAMDES